VTRLLLGISLALALATTGCSKESSEQSQPVVEPLPQDEIQRGQTACQSYVDRLCECAKTQSDMADACALAKARPEALKLNIDLMSSPGLPVVEAQAVKVEARKIIAACFADEGRLDPVKCPRL
jgi:hypothetical protein